MEVLILMFLSLFICFFVWQLMHTIVKADQKEHELLIQELNKIVHGPRHEWMYNKDEKLQCIKCGFIAGSDVIQ